MQHRILISIAECMKQHVTQECYLMDGVFKIKVTDFNFCICCVVVCTTQKWEYRLDKDENVVLKGICGPTREEFMVVNLHSDDHYNV